MNKLKKFLTVIFSSIIIILMFGCSKNETIKSIEFGDDLKFTKHENYITIDLENSSELIKEKHKKLSETLSNTEILNEIVALTTTTANILYEAGITPIGAPESESLLSAIKENQYKLNNSNEFNKDKILNIGSALSPNTELIIELNPKLALYSDAFNHADYISTLENANIKVNALGQSDYTDMFILIDVLGKLYNYQNEQVNNLMKNMVSSLEQTNTLIDNNKTEEKKTIAILQIAGDSILVNGDNSVIGRITKSINLENIFASSQNVELNQEALISGNPDYIIYYTHGTSDDVLNIFNEKLIDPNGNFYILDAVKNGRAFPIKDDNNKIKFIGSVDLKIVDIIQFLAKKIYE